MTGSNCQLLEHASLAAANMTLARQRDEYREALRAKCNQLERATVECDRIKLALQRTRCMLVLATALLAAVLVLSVTLR